MHRQGGTVEYLAIAFTASIASHPSPDKVLIPLTLMRSSIPACSERHASRATFSRLTLTLSRGWSPDDVQRLLGNPEVRVPHRESLRESIQGAGDRFCLNRVALAEVADPALNHRLPSPIQAARAITQEGRGVSIRYGARRWVAVAPADVVKEGGDVVVVSPVSGFSCRRVLQSVGPAWGGVAVIVLVPPLIGQQPSPTPSPPSLHLPLFRR